MRHLSQSVGSGRHTGLILNTHVAHGRVRVRLNAIDISAETIVFGACVRVRLSECHICPRLCAGARRPGRLYLRIYAQMFARDTSVTKRLGISRRPAWMSEHQKGFAERTLKSIDRITRHVVQSYFE